MTGSFQAANLFPEKPVIHFAPENQDCPVCNSSLHVQKSVDPKIVVALDIGAFVAKQSVLFCPHGHGLFKSRQLQKLVPKGGTFGFDVRGCLILGPTNPDSADGSEKLKVAKGM